MIACGALLLSAYSRGGQDVQTPPTEKPKAPVQTGQRGHIVGVGGVFFKSANREQMREWYSKHLGLADQAGGGTVLSVFPKTTTYFGAGQEFMINYIVDDLDALLARLKDEGVKIDPKRMNAAYGRFAWIYDSDGNKIELWQPAAKP